MSEEPEPVDETDEKAELYITDPDDYAKTRKLKALNDAKDHIRKVRNDRPVGATADEWTGMRRQLAKAVASYGHELLPLLEEAEQAGTIDKDDYYARGNRDIRTIILSDGMMEADDGEMRVPDDHVSMVIFRHLQGLERKLGLGLDLEPEQNDEWEIET